MIVIYRKGIPTVGTGWRASLIMLAAAVACDDNRADAR
jgi:hypothetical protein